MQFVHYLEFWLSRGSWIINRRIDGSIGWFFSWNYMFINQNFRQFVEQFFNFFYLKEINVKPIHHRELQVLVGLFLNITTKPSSQLFSVLLKIIMFNP